MHGIHAGPVSLVDHEHIGDLDDPGFVGLNLIPPAGPENQDDDVDMVHHLQLGLADSHCLDENHVETCPRHGGDGRSGGNR